ncbi:MAG: transglutaminase-like domain-containing protein [Cyclobacteriaceae bacterium]
MENKEIKALISLLDDQDVQVAGLVEQKIRSLGTGIIPHLEKEWESALSPDLQSRIENLIHDLQTELLKERLQEWHNSPDRDLLTGMWIVATIQYPDLDLQKLRQELEQIHYDVWLTFSDGMTVMDRIKALNSVLFSKLRFGANTRNFHSPGNSMINVVLESKKGNPISLCVIYMLVATKLKLPVHGVNLPNMFMLLCRDESHDFYINAFNRGLIFTRKDLETYILEIQLTPQSSFFEPCSNEDIIRRSLRNLVIAFDKLGEHARSEEVKALLLSISDGGTADL